jgi:hypothetical protein
MQLGGVPGIEPAEPFIFSRCGSAADTEVEVSGMTTREDSDKTPGFELVHRFFPFQSLTPGDASQAAAL